LMNSYWLKRRSCDDALTLWHHTVKDTNRKTAAAADQKNSCVNRGRIVPSGQLRVD
jgi:hypothetical protein